MNNTRNDDIDMNSLVARAKNGDQNAVADLYERTYDKVFYTVKSMIKDEDTVFDIVQDSYMKAFSHLDSFQGGEKFPAWMKMIAANTARDWLKKQKPMLFSELNTNDDMDEPAEAQFVDERNENLPEWVIEQEETKRLLREILDALPEDQRAAIGMYYYEELSVKDIAAAMGCTESAVKSRLMYGRKKVEKEVRDLEKKGTKLYGLAGIPFLLWLFRSQEVYAAERRAGAAAAVAGAAAAGAAATGGTAAAGTAAAIGTAAAGAAGATAAGLGGLKLGLLIAAAVAVVGGSVFGIVKAVNKNEPTPVVITSYEGTGERLTDAAKEESAAPTKPAQPQTQAPQPHTEPTKEMTTEETLSPEQQFIQDALQAYREILARADSIEFDMISGMKHTGYRYALVRMQKEDVVPTLLLAKEWDEMYWLTRVFQYDPKTGTVFSPADQLQMGMTQLFGYRGGLNLETDGNGLANIDFSGGSWSGVCVRITMENGTLKYQEQWSGHAGDEDQPDVEIIEYKRLTDLSYFNEWEGKAAGKSAQPGGIQTTEAGKGGIAPGANTPNGPQAVTLPSDGSRIVFAGTVKRCTYDEVIRLQGEPDPNAQWSDHSRTFLLIILDEPQKMSLHLGDENALQARTVRWIRLSDNYAQYAGQHHVFSIDPWTTYYPTDTSLPLGAPGTGDLHILN